MSKTKMFSSRWGAVAAAIGVLLLVALVLAACGGEPTAAPTTPPEPTEVAAEPATPTKEPPTPTDVPTEVPPTPTEEPPTPTPEPTEPPPTATPTEEPTPEVVDDTACIICHTDEETLKAVAVEPEESESLSEGEG